MRDYCSYEAVTQFKRLVNQSFSLSESEKNQVLVKFKEVEDLMEQLIGER